ncbi:MAG: hypothetical protein HOP12_08535 [Candidatus Eisenbacteria bacterium]|uniref:Uncharacterized protein n=1 Tax=Eiseniibacteriota bacterium TaxID=2212470 RepID=A0A849SYN9_UNCEI|nr:hypothetical protein [Candidatus Eisenbacteria bacterium]
MTTFTIQRGLAVVTLVVALGTLRATPVHARADEALLQEFRAAYPEAFGDGQQPIKGRTPNQINAIPDIFGPGAVLTVGNVYLKLTNNGIIGNPFTNLSSDPSLQWPGASSIEYLAFGLLAVGGVNPTATDPAAVRRVSYSQEWRPATLEPEDRMYRSFDGAPGAARLTNDDGDVNPSTGRQRIDEDFLDGRDNDGDGLIDEDYAALGQQMYSCSMRDDTPAAINLVANEKHIPLGVELRQIAWAYSIPGNQDFNPIEFTVINRSGHVLDSLYFGIRSDMDCGPIDVSNYFTDDFDVPFFPFGVFPTAVAVTDPRRQIASVMGDTVSMCPMLNININGFSVVDDEGDGGRTRGVPSILLMGMTLDPLGALAPSKVRFHSFRSHLAGTPYTDGGNPTIDQQRYEFMSGNDNIDPESGHITLERGDQRGDYQTWFSVGPFNQLPDGGSFSVTVCYAMQRGELRTLVDYPFDYARFNSGLISSTQLFQKYPALANAYTAQVAYEGVYEEPRPGFEDDVPKAYNGRPCFGCETGVQLPLGTPQRTLFENCGGEVSGKIVNDREKTWFNFDCDFCTGVYSETRGIGFYLRHWNAESPPPNPNLNLSSIYNFSDNPDRTSDLVPGGDRRVTLAWDNVAETTADPKTGEFDFRSYRLWKVSNWRRPVGASGPSDEEWALLGEYRLFDYRDSNQYWRVNPLNSAESTLVCPKFYIPESSDSMEICLRRGDVWNRQNGHIIRPDTTLACVLKGGECQVDSGLVVGSRTQIIKRTRYPIGRYRFVDTEVKNGFVYFYAVTSGDSTTTGTELFGRRAATETEYVVPQVSAATGTSVYVVPNPYRGYSDLSRRPSAWDLTPNASDPTGTHIDFLGMPRGQWGLRIYSVSGDLVAQIKSDDAVNADIRQPVTSPSGVVREGFNRQQDNPNDGQARWNLISRNGQDVVSGIYVFVVESDQGTQRGTFVIIR